MPVNGTVRLMRKRDQCYCKNAQRSNMKMRQTKISLLLVSLAMAAAIVVTLAEAPHSTNMA